MGENIFKGESMEFLPWLLLILLLPLAALLLYALFLCLFSLHIDFKKPIEKVSGVCLKAVHFFAWVVNAVCGVRIKTTGMEKLPKDQRFIFVCNHRSMFDPISAMHVLRNYCVSFIAKPSVFRIPLIGKIVYGMGCLPIDRENDRQALKDLLQAADYVKKDFCSMGIYPEGTRSKEAELLPFHAGSFKLAQKAGVGLAIAATTGTEKVHRNVLRRRTDVELHILEFIPAETVKEKKAAELADYSRERIAACLED